MNKWEAARNILCVRLDAIGDVLMTTPALRALKTARSDRRITLLTSPAGADIAALVPEIDEIIVYQPPWMKATPQRADAGIDYAMVETLRKRSFDGAVIFTVYSQSPLPAAMLCYFAGIPLRLAHCHENPYQLIPDWVIDPEPQRVLRHEVQRQLDLVAHIGGKPGNENLSLRVPPRLKTAMETRLKRIGLKTSRPWVLIHPGATAPSRRYPAEAYAAAAGDLVRHHDCQVAFSGATAERALIRDIQKAMEAPSVSLAGQLSVHELVATVALAPVLVVNNTGPAHIAAAVGTPVVDLYALTNLQHTPWQVQSRVLFADVPCKSCYKSVCPEGHHRCLRGVAPSQVVQAVLELLAAPRGAGATVMPPPPAPAAMAPRFGTIAETGT